MSFSRAEIRARDCILFLFQEIFRETFQLRLCSNSRKFSRENCTNEEFKVHFEIDGEREQRRAFLNIFN